MTGVLAGLGCEMGEKSGGMAGNLLSPLSTNVSFLSIWDGGENGVAVVYDEVGGKIFVVVDVGEKVLLVYDEESEGWRILGDAGDSANSRCSNSDRDGKLCLNSLGVLTVSISSPSPAPTYPLAAVDADVGGMIPVGVLRSNAS